MSNRSISHLTPTPQHNWWKCNPVTGVTTCLSFIFPQLNADRSEALNIAPEPSREACYSPSTALLYPVATSNTSAELWVLSLTVSRSQLSRAFCSFIWSPKCNPFLSTKNLLPVIHLSVSPAYTTVTRCIKSHSILPLQNSTKKQQRDLKQKNL